ncbi:voltage-dependent anion-selective channel protein [Coccomyxa subellipsoidea C-169]|uniref:Voltage-dependent anion-selective channel protein n=1 Tax=Coccomyxa subellipsoidea (strain C-169) TaxID=574566 RepID=I0YYR2_COCSC|nr:voltage-dependent anion-selective channel protein [Coccomyxa subellipsoidea C-169]EIE23531.1 voltage-dependent anion-selective channel protein [Coccomyxa subellipsoidea C-169]|eukprot:XP_005648075.1 voltage-dependent anion-selective channel protein [Coccomyxa subellipsoidea C-169]
MTAKIPAFTDIGKATRELLYGSKSGVFQYNQALNISTKTADGVEFSVVTVKKEDRIEGALKANYKTKKYGFTGTFGSTGLVSTSVAVYSVAPGLDVTLFGTLPDVQGSAKVSADYVVPHLTLKTSVGLTNQPKVDLAATTGYKDIVFGGEATYDSAKGDVTKWAAGAGYQRLDYAVGVLLKDMGKVMTVSYAHNVDATTAAGAEVSKRLDEKEFTTFTLGLQKRLENGALAKFRLDNAGIASALYETELKPNHKLAISSQFNATDLNKPPKLGFALDIKN